MTDDLEPLRRSRPDRLLPDDPPDPEILARGKARLMSAITGPDGVVKHRRTPSIYPRLAYRDEVAALDFLTRVFGLAERRESRMEDPEGMLAWLEIGDGVVMIGRAGAERHGLYSPLETGAPTAMANVYVHDIDAHYRRAESEGAQIVTPLEDMFWGDRATRPWIQSGTAGTLPSACPRSRPVRPGHRRRRTGPYHGWFRRRPRPSTTDTPAPPRPPGTSDGHSPPSHGSLKQGAWPAALSNVGCGTGEHALLGLPGPRGARRGHRTPGNRAGENRRRPPGPSRRRSSSSTYCACPSWARSSTPSSTAGSSTASTTRNGRSSSRDITIDPPEHWPGR